MGWVRGFCFLILCEVSAAIPLEVRQFLLERAIVETSLSRRALLSLRDEIRHCRSGQNSQDLAHHLLVLAKSLQYSSADSSERGVILGQMNCLLWDLADFSGQDARIRQDLQREMKRWISQWDLLSMSSGVLHLDSGWLLEQGRIREEESFRLLAARQKDPVLNLKEPARRILNRAGLWTHEFLKKLEKLDHQEKNARRTGLLLLLWAPMSLWLFKIFRNCS